MTTKAIWKVVAKNGDSEYELNSGGHYENKPIDYVEEFENFQAALQEFLNWTEENNYDGGLKNKVSLVYVPKTGKKVKKVAGGY